MKHLSHFKETLSKADVSIMMHVTDNNYLLLYTKHAAACYYHYPWLFHFYNGQLGIQGETGKGGVIENVQLG